MEKFILTEKPDIVSLPCLYERYSMDIYRYALSILKDKDDAKDAVQETFLRYAENEEKFRGDASQKTWLLVTARNYCYSRLRRSENRNERIDTDLCECTCSPEYDSLISLGDALKLLSREMNELLYLKEYCGYSYQEIAGITSQSIENVRIKLFRARRKLKGIMKDDK